MTSASTPLVVYDSRSPDWPPPEGNLERILNWATEHGIDVAYTYRIEVYLLDCWFARVYQFIRGDTGGVLIDPALREAAKRDPFDVIVTRLPE